jgi:hypothetical protein
MSKKIGEKLFQPSINLERSEYRYIFYAHDQTELIRDFIDLGFKVVEYKDSPITKTIYFGSKKGLKPGLSIKGRIYSPSKTENIWYIDSSTVFNLLEIKSTINQEEAFQFGIMDDLAQESLISKSKTKNFPSDVIFQIQKASEGRLLFDSSIKSKSRLRKEDLTTIGKNPQENLLQEEVIEILTKSGTYDDHLSENVLELLNKKIRPLYYNSIIPYVMTQYSRKHLIPTNDEWEDIIRITIDPGVDFYEVILDDPDNYIKNQQARIEYLSREHFSRLEFKINPQSIKRVKDLDRTIGNIIRKYRCIGYISKKWSGVTSVSERHIEKQAFWREPLYKNISGFFPVDSSWFSYGSVTEGLLQLIKNSESFTTFEKNPRVLVKNQNFVQGYLGMPSPSLIVTVEGPIITYNLPPTSYPIKLTANKPEFYIMEEFVHPVRSTTISSRSQLDKFLHSSIEIEGYSFFRSYGFLVTSTQSDRVYKLTIERKTAVKEALDYQSDENRMLRESKIYCKMRYVGTKNRLYKINEQRIYDELEKFYDEFSPQMSKPLVLSESLINYQAL